MKGKEFATSLREIAFMVNKATGYFKRGNLILSTANWIGKRGIELEVEKER